MTDYKPISCIDYDRYEIAIMRKHQMHLVWREGNVIYDQVITPLNLHTQSGEEFLELRLPDGQVTRVRLDQIRRAEAV